VNSLPLPRVGHIEFLNCFPLSWGLEQVQAEKIMTLHANTPDVLSDQLVAGELDVGPISLVEALAHADDLVVLPEVAVGSAGPVRSVCLISKVPLEQLGGQRIGLSSTSRTSIVLAQILLSQRWGIQATFEQLDPQTAASLVSVPAAVLIGDPALKATLVDGPANDWNVVDLGQAWFEWTGLPMVFAVWAARRDFAQAHPEQLASVRATFAAGLDQADSQPQAVAHAAAQISDFSPDQLQEYFLGLDFGLSAQARSGIAEFSARLAGFSADFGARSLDFLPSLEPI